MRRATEWTKRGVVRTRTRTRTRCSCKPFTSTQDLEPPPLYVATTKLANGSIIATVNATFPPAFSVAGAEGSYNASLLQVGRGRSTLTRTRMRVSAHPQDRRLTTCTPTAAARLGPWG